MMTTPFYAVLRVLVLLAVFVSSANAATVRLFLIGNSFSQAAARYLPEIAKAGGHELILGRAELPGAPMSARPTRSAR